MFKQFALHFFKGKDASVKHISRWLTFPNGKNMPIVGLGTYEARNEDLETSVEAALKAGYRHIDTAYVYDNEKAIGKVLKKWFSSGKLTRNDLFITTKLPMIGVHPDRVEKFMRASLNNLQLEYVDLYLVHFPVGCKHEEGALRPSINSNGEVEIEEITDHKAIWKKMEEQVDRKRASNIGLSNFNISQIANICKSARIKPSNLQVELHVYLQQKELVEFCNKNGISVVAYAPLGNPSYNKLVERIGQKPRDLPSILNDSIIDSLAEKYKKTPAQIALRFLIQKGIVVIPKSVTPKRIQENIDIFDFSLSDTEMLIISELDKGEAGRVYNFQRFPGLEKSTEFPFHK